MALRKSVGGYFMVNPVICAGCGYLMAARAIHSTQERLAQCESGSWPFDCQFQGCPNAGLPLDVPVQIVND